MIYSVFAFMLSATVLTACSEDDYSADPAKDWAGTTNFFLSTDDEGFNTYYMPAIGRCGDPMPFYDQKAGDFKVLYLQEYDNNGPCYHPFWGITSKKIDITGTPLNPIPDEISVTFKLTYDVGYGNSILVAGNWDNWQLHNAQWTAGNVWTVTLNLPVEVGDTIEFKFVEDLNGEHIYQKGDNNTYVIIDLAMLR